jgi:hypothetical protein
VKTAATGVIELSSVKQTQLQFWTEFRAFMEKTSQIRCQKPSAQHSMNHPLGRSGMHLASIASSWDSETGTLSPELRVELVLDGKDAKSQFATLENNGSSEEIVGGFRLGQLAK